VEASACKAAWLQTSTGSCVSTQYQALILQRRNVVESMPSTKHVCKLPIYEVYTARDKGLFSKCGMLQRELRRGRIWPAYSRRYSILTLELAHECMIERDIAGGGRNITYRAPLCLPALWDPQGCTPKVWMHCHPVHLHSTGSSSHPCLESSTCASLNVLMQSERRRLMSTSMCHAKGMKDTCRYAISQEQCINVR